MKVNSGKPGTVSGMWVLLLGGLYFLTSLAYYPFSLLINRCFSNILACNFLKLTGIPCPTCGASRAAYYFAVCDFMKSFTHHPAIFFLSTYVLLAVIYAVFKTAKKQDIMISCLFNRYLFIFLAAVTVIFWAAKLFI